MPEVNKTYDSIDTEKPIYWEIGLNLPREVISMETNWPEEKLELIGVTGLILFLLFLVYKCYTRYRKTKLKQRKDSNRGSSKIRNDPEYF